MNCLMMLSSHSSLSVFFFVGAAGLPGEASTVAAEAARLRLGRRGAGRLASAARAVGVGVGVLVGNGVEARGGGGGQNVMDW